MRKIKVMPYITEINDMLEALNKDYPQEAIAAGDLEKTMGLLGCYFWQLDS